MRANLTLVPIMIIGTLAAGCGSQDIPQAHKGRMFDRTGGLALYTGGKGFTGPILGPGTYWTGIYDEVRLVDCSVSTQKEAMTALTKDGVQFKLDVYVRYGADCSDASVGQLLTTLSPDKGHVISSEQLYANYVRPALGEAVRETVSPHRANDINDRREEILSNARKSFMEMVAKSDPKAVVIHEVILSNLDFPDEMDHANVERAVQAVLKDKAIAEREKVEAEIETAKMRRELAEREGDVEAAKIDKVGAALRRNPEYLQFDMQARMPEIYKAAGAGGNLVLAAPSPQVLIAPKGGK
jgi:regulator of protease activity HflC (stomatin/prohibitin superfamily)